MELRDTIDYTLLKQDCTHKQIQQLCEIAKTYRLYAVCVLPYYVRAAVNYLEDSATRICTVVGFPLGATYVTAKLLETELAMQKGAHEVDVVMNLAAFKSGDWDTVREELRRMRDITALKNVVLKVIIESGALSIEELTQVCALCAETSPDFVKTSTGTYNPGAELEKVELMRKILPPEIQIKAAGGIRTAEKAKLFLEAGANRIGASTLFVEPISIT